MADRHRVGLLALMQIVERPIRIGTHTFGVPHALGDLRQLHQNFGDFGRGASLVGLENFHGPDRVPFGLGPDSQSLVGIGQLADGQKVLAGLHPVIFPIGGLGFVERAEGIDIALKPTAHRAQVVGENAGSGVAKAEVANGELVALARVEQGLLEILRRHGLSVFRVGNLILGLRGRDRLQLLFAFRGRVWVRVRFRIRTLALGEEADRPEQEKPEQHHQRTGGRNMGEHSARIAQPEGAVVR